MNKTPFDQNINNQQQNSNKIESDTPALDFFSIDLTQEAKE
jgi:hypothetical protein